MHTVWSRRLMMVWSQTSLKRRFKLWGIPCWWLVNTPEAVQFVAGSGLVLTGNDSVQAASDC
jgi:uncharacterized protein (DUF2062 family)